MFCSESKEQNTYCNNCMMATIKVNACYTVKSYKNKLRKNSNRGAPVGAPLAMENGYCYIDYVLERITH